MGCPPGPPGSPLELPLLSEVTFELRPGGREKAKLGMNGGQAFLEREQRVQRAFGKQQVMFAEQEPQWLALQVQTVRLAGCQQPDHAVFTI